MPPKNNPISNFLRNHFKHYNADTLVRAADAWIDMDRKGGKMMVTLAGAFSTGEIGKLLAELIRRDKIAYISCTGANLEEDIFNLIGNPYYKRVPGYKDLGKAGEKRIYDSGANRVTDTIVPDFVMVPVAEAMRKVWIDAWNMKERLFPHEALRRVLRSGKLQKYYEADPSESWMLAALEKNIPIVVPGWGDSTLGNNFAALCIQYPDISPSVCKSDIEYMMSLAEWYANYYQLDPQPYGLGFFQVGGGIAGDFPICVVPMLHEELKMETTQAPKFRYFCQITDAEVSYGGYSGAEPNEKITWGKLDVDTPSFNIKSDASIVAPLIFALVLDL
jgi:deoxyhypusine synthase